jgi:hypothetical protein
MRSNRIFCKQNRKLDQLRDLPSIPRRIAQRRKVQRVLDNRRNWQKSTGHLVCRTLHPGLFRSSVHFDFADVSPRFAYCSVLELIFLRSRSSPVGRCPETSIGCLPLARSWASWRRAGNRGLSVQWPEPEALRTGFTSPPPPSTKLTRVRRRATYKARREFGCERMAGKRRGVVLTFRG